MADGTGKLELEKEKIKRAKKDIGEFDYLYRKYYPMINNYVYHRVGDREIRNEIVSNVFFKAMKKIELFRFFDSQRTSFSAWLYRIAGNEICQYFRQNKRRNNIIEQVKLNSPTPQDSHPENPRPVLNFETVRKYLSELSQDDQNLITLRFFEKLSYREISQIFRKKEGALKVRMHRALNKLRGLLDKELSHEESGRYPF